MKKIRSKKMVGILKLPVLKFNYKNYNFSFVILSVFTKTLGKQIGWYIINSENLHMMQ